MRARIDISQVEADTKIRAKYLRAIENEEWELLPGPVYARSFLRTYGDYLGLDSRLLVDEFRRRHERPSERDTRPIGTRRVRERERPPRRRIPPWVSIAAVVVLILLALGLVGSLTGNSTPSGGSARHSVAAKRRSRHVTSPVTTPVRAPLPTTVTLHMVPTGPVYVCLVRGDGTRLIYEHTYAPGQTIPTETGARLLLTLGNNNVHMVVNGHPIPVAPSPNAIRLMITPPDSVRPIPLSQPPTCP